MTDDEVKENKKKICNKKVIFCGFFDKGSELKLKFLEKVACKAVKRRWDVVFVDQGVLTKKKFPSFKGSIYLHFYWSEGLLVRRLLNTLWILIKLPRQALEAWRVDFLTNKGKQEYTWLRSILGIGGLVEFFNSHMKLKEGDLLVLWAYYWPFHRLIDPIVKSKKAKVVYLEYASLPGFVIFSDAAGFQGRLTNIDHKLFNILPVRKIDMKKAQAYIQFVIRQKKSMKIYRLKDMPTDIKIDKRKKILVIGSELPATGMIPKWAKSSRMFSPIFVSNEDLLLSIAKKAKKRNWLLIYKKHPQMLHYPSLTVRRVKLDGYPIAFIKNVEIHEVLKQSDVVISLGSSVLQLGLMREKPGVLVGTTGLNRKGCCYEISNRQDLTVAIDKAVKFGLQNTQKQSFIEYVARELKYHCFALTDNYKKYCPRGPESAWQSLEKYHETGRREVFLKRD